MYKKVNMVGLQIQTLNFFSVFRKTNIRYFNPFRLTDPFRRWHILKLLYETLISAEVCNENFPRIPNFLLWVMVEIAVIGSDIQVQTDQLYMAMFFWYLQKVKPSP